MREKLPRFERFLASLFLRGPEAEFVLGDLAERYADDLAGGMTRTRAGSRLRRHILASGASWWRPAAIIARR